MNQRTRKVQARYKVSGTVGQRKTKVSPALELAGNWFQDAGFTPGQLVHVETRNGEILIRPVQ